MKSPEVLTSNKKINWAIIIPIVMAIVIVAVFLFLDYQKQRNASKKEQSSISEEYRPQPISRKDNPRRSEVINNLSRYGCANPATIEPLITKNADTIWKIPKDGSSHTISLGKYKIINSQYTILDIPTLWLYFVSDKLSDRDDKIYAPESSYVAGMKIIVNGHEKEIKLGGDEYMLIELSDYPLGDIYPYDKKTILEFEVLLELKCNNFKNNICLDNHFRALKFPSNTDIGAQFRIFAVGCQEFTHDIFTESKLVVE
jgi:hypothetical protein